MIDTEIQRERETKKETKKQRKKERKKERNEERRKERKKESERPLHSYMGNKKLHLIMYLRILTYKHLEKTEFSPSLPILLRRSLFSQCHVYLYTYLSLKFQGSNYGTKVRGQLSNRKALGLIPHVVML